MKKYIAELIGTFALVFCGTGAIIINEQTGGTVSHVGIAATFGLIVLAMIYTFGEISGAHFNPAVTIAFCIVKLFPLKHLGFYIIFQIAGAILASLILKQLFPENINLGMTIPYASALQSFIIELILTFFLMTVILNVSQGSKEVGLMAGIAIGATVLLEAMFAGPISGASMNPARSIGPAFIVGNPVHQWIYLASPVSGAVIAALLWKFMQGLKS